MRAILMSSIGSDGQSHKTVSTNHNVFEEKGEPKRYRTEVPFAYKPNALPLGQTGSLRKASYQADNALVGSETLNTAVNGAEFRS